MHTPHRGPDHRPLPRVRDPAVRPPDPGPDASPDRTGHHPAAALDARVVPGPGTARPDRSDRAAGEHLVPGPDQPHLTDRSDI
ncbi:hypothetical protein [Kitasatospora sp. NPDC059327]|uniref:hypothetical protein n=1 Tax=Kitasatospora sp. NPDC059327 TaxID=3346803 RepID=UPI0036C849AC